MSDQNEATDSRGPAQADNSASPTIAPTMQLSRRGLILSLVAMVCSGLAVYAIFPDSVGGPPLPVSVALGHQPVETTGGKGQLLTPVVIVRNESDEPIPRLTLEINGQYLLLQQSPLPTGEPIVLPQGVFTDKRSNQRFNPAKYEVEEVTVTGQLPSGARGVSQFEFAAGQPKLE